MMQKKNCLRLVITFFLLIISAVPVHADGIKLDGTIGTARNLSLPGPDYEIKAEYGKQSGANLFHSFQQFNIHFNESATFSGPDSVQNIISRVTGGDSSWIDGRLSSSIPGADLYLLNPAGVMFGPNASLDISGSFHVSTADYLRMGENEQFYTMPSENDVLSVEPATAFGFLDSDVEPITFEAANLDVLEGETISVIGGNIEIKRGGLGSIGSLNAFEGININIAGIMSEGEVISSKFGLDVSSFEEKGDITLFESSLVGSSVFISCGRFFVDNMINDNIDIPSLISLLNGDFIIGGEINIYASEIVDISGGSWVAGFLGEADDFTIKTKKLSVNGAVIFAAKDGDININSTETISLCSSTGISAGAYGNYDGGDITIETKSLSLNDGVYITSSSIREGNAGNITIHSSEELSLSHSWIAAGSHEYGDKAGDGGDILITTKRLSLNDGSDISSLSLGTGNAGDIIIGKDISSDSISLENSKITTEAQNSGGGKVSIHIKESLLMSNSEIETSVFDGKENGGDINISNPQFVTMNNSNMFAKAHEGDGGNIRIATDHLIQSSDSELNASSELGINGEIIIESPNTDISKSLTMLPDNYIDATRWAKTPCEKRTGEDVSHFVSTVRDAAPTSPDGWQPSPPLPFDNEHITQIGNIGQLLAKGEKFYHKGDFANAAKTWEKAIPLLDSEDGIYLHTLTYLANTYQTLGFHKKALSGLLKNLSIVEENKTSYNHYHKAIFFSTLGDIFLSLGNNQPVFKETLNKVKKYLKQETPLEKNPHKLAKIYLQKGLEQAHLAENPHVLAIALNNMGNFLTSERDYDEAMATYEESLESADLVHELSLKSKTMINIILTRLEDGNNYYDDILKIFNNAYREIKNSPDSHDKAFNLISLSLLIRKTGKEFDKSDYLRPYAREWLKHAKKIAKSLEDTPVLSYTHGYLGQLHEDEERHSEAIKETQTAIFLAQQGYYPELSYLWQWQMGRVLRNQGDIENSINAYKKAAEILNPAWNKEKLRDQGDIENSIKAYKKAADPARNKEKNNPPGIIHELFSGYRCKKSVFYEKVKPVYIQLAEMLLNDSGRFSEARNIMEDLKTTELQDFYQDECVKAKQKKWESIKMPPHTAMLYIIPLQDSLALLLTLNDDIKLFNNPIDSKNFRKTVRNFSEKVVLHNDRYLVHAKKLYNYLIEPIQKDLADHKVDTLVIIPDDVLRLIPFSALHDGNQFLIEKYALVTVPAITITNIEPPERKIISSSLLNGVSKGKHPLPNVPKELNDIKEITKGKILLDETFNLENLENEFKNQPYSNVLMATHAQFRGTSEETFIKAYDGKITMDMLKEFIELGMFRKQKIELLILSACETAKGDERAAMGLAGVAVKAGVKSVIATLWPVSDEGAPLVVTEFYRQLKNQPEISKAKALQKAQKILIRLSNPEYKHPGYWAPFLLIGNWL
ncbi:MAG: CHAT domain-containing protein [Desulfobacterales bacterium]|nr:CHAT domain-containing protein [Desulfobacterales bacterium]